jgi:hypothetical protein
MDDVVGDAEDADPPTVRLAAAVEVDGRGEVRSPRIENHGDADLDAEPLRVAAKAT